MKDKLERSLGCLDDLGISHNVDQRHVLGHAEVPTTVLSSDGPVRQLCLLGDSTTVACASERGPLWVFNWREGRVVSRMRDRADGSAGRPDGPVLRLCSAAPDHSLLASGDEHGFVALWDLQGPALDTSARLHERRVTGLEAERDGERLISTSADTYLVLYDMGRRQVVERGVPAPCACGSGVPNTILALGGETQRHLLFVGGADGNLRVWTKDQGPLRREHTLPCEACPTQCRLASDGWRVVVGTRPGDPAFCTGRSEAGGLLLFDLRRLGGGPGAALVARREADGLGAGAAGADPPPDATGSGVTDVALVERDGECFALCLTDGPLRAFDLQGPRGVLSHRFDLDILAPHDADLHGLNRPCAMAATGRMVFTATTAPSLCVWYRQDPDEPYGHGSYVRQPPPPMTLQARFVPAPAPRSPRALTAMEKLEDALEMDRLRLGGLPRVRAPFEPFRAAEDALPG